MKYAVLLFLGLVLLLPGSARANGDPASDVLLTQQVFFPFEAPISTSAKNDLTQTVATANQKGYTIRVAIIAFTGDLGTAVALWGHPQAYAKFLWNELAFEYRNRVLVAMPSGFGFYDDSKPIAKELAVLKTVPPGKIPTALTESATEAVRRLAAANGVIVPKPGGGSATRDRVIILVVALVVLAGAVFFSVRLLRRRPQGVAQ